MGNQKCSLKSVHVYCILRHAIYIATGPLGQGVANAVGLALAEAHLAARFNKPDAVIVDHRTYFASSTKFYIYNVFFLP